MRISVVIPTLNEAPNLAATLAAIPPGADEVVVADGGSDDATRDIAAGARAKVVAAPRGRGPQMNAGAAAATGDALVFLHADTRLSPDAFDLVRRLLSEPGVAGGAFHLAIEGNGAFGTLPEKPDFFYAFTARNANIRSKLLGAPYGDQAFFVTRSAFDALGGFRALPACEDLDFIRRLRHAGRVVMAPASASTSGRRWATQGRISLTVRNFILFLRYWLGRL